MKYRLSILNCATVLFIAGCGIYTVINYSTLSAGEGWGVLYMLGLICWSATALVVDLLIQRIFKRRGAQNIAGILVIVAYMIILYLES